MKIIDLLNKIVNGEEVPKKIKYEKYIYEYEEGTYDWSYYIENNGTIKFLLTDVFNSNDNILSILNNEVEIIEENKIPKTLNKLLYREDYATQNACIDDIIRQFNNLIDYLKSKGE